MKRVLQALGKTLSQSILLVCLLALIGIGNLVTLPAQPVYAAGLYSTQTQQEAKITDPAESFDAVNPQEAYDEMVKTAQNPNKVEKVYEESLEEYREEHPPEGIIQKIEESIEKVTDSK
ncbi:MAG: hypothetical protein HC786_14770 [Richelia sp. CSU_2_1]|nr:hypothetical protein [Microcoleus sp. SU_5_6]NJL69859.1 hypothetical protein [Microcoleus sp. SM1_3_4]NJR23325.1 hypothetical protein [Richelia sp. CSU_2_1]